MGVRVSRSWVVAAFVAAVLIVAGAPSHAWAQPEQAGQKAPAQSAAAPAAEATPTGHAAESEGHGSGGLVPTIARLVNFLILAGTLVYFLRSPAATYLRNRKEQIRSDLVKAQQMRTAAAAQIAAIEERMKSLPAELDALRTSGAEEVAAEDARIRQAAAAERDRFLERARHDINAQLKLAERELIRHAADLAVAIATERIKTTITAADQARLVDRYLSQVGPPGRMTS
jgi:F0F1-type ATP synthase membrane subunit b/b'